MTCPFIVQSLMCTLVYTVPLGSSTPTTWRRDPFSGLSENKPPAPSPSQNTTSLSKCRTLQKLQLPPTSSVLAVVGFRDVSVAVSFLCCFGSLLKASIDFWSFLGMCVPVSQSLVGFCGDVRVWQSQGILQWGCWWRSCAATIPDLWRVMAVWCGTKGLPGRSQPF